MTPLTIAAGFIVVFGLSLVILIIVIFSDFELTDAGDNLDLPTRRSLGKSLLLHSFIGITLMLCFSSGVVSLKYLLGTLCSLVAVYLMASGLRMILRATEKIEIDSSDTISREINQIEHAIRSQDKLRIVRLAGLSSLLVTVVLFLKKFVADQLSLFDIIGLALMLVSIEFFFIAHRIEEKKRLRSLQSRLTKLE